MKTLVTTLLIIICMSSYNINAQENDSISIDTLATPVIIEDNEEGVSVIIDEVVKEESRDTSKVETENEDNEKHDKFSFNFDEEEACNKFKGHWAGIHLGLNGFFDDDFSMSRTAENSFMDLNTGRSWNFTLNFAQFSQKIISDRFGIVTGLGFEINNYRFDGNNSIEEVSGIVRSKNFIDTTLLKSKLTTYFLTVPILLEGQFLKGSRNKRIFFNAGIIAGLKLKSHTKIKYEINDEKRKEKNRDDFSINPLRIGLTASIGYDDIGIYCTYYLTPLFEDNKGPELYPFNVGLAMKF